MNIQIAVRHDTTDGKIRKFIEIELDRIMEKYSPISADVVIDHEGHTGLVKTAEFNVHVPGELLHVKESSDDVHKSIEIGIRTLEKKLQKFKDTRLKTSSLKRQLGNAPNGGIMKDEL